MKLSHIIPKIMAVFTQKEREIVVPEWSGGKSYVHDIFRVYEVIFGRRKGIRCEYTTEKGVYEGKIVIRRRFFTLESICAYSETVIRNALSGVSFGFEWVELPRVQLAGIFNDQSDPNVPKMPIFTFAIALDTSSDHFTAAGTTDTLSHTCTGTNLTLLSGTFKFGGGDNVTSMVYAGSGMTQLGKISSDASGYTYLYGLGAPSTGANNIVSTASGSVQWFVTASSYTGTNTTTPFPDTGVTGTSSSTSFTLTITTTVDQSWLIAIGRSPSKTPVAGANTIVRRLNAGSGDAAWMLDSDGARGTGSQSLAYTYAGSSTSYWVLSSLAPSASTPIVPSLASTGVGA